MEKAYDRLEWKFFSAVLKGFGFQNKIHVLIMLGVQGARFYILINGNPEVNIIPARGIIQGCAFSPYSFNLCSKVLLCLINKMVEQGKCRGIRINRYALMISQLMFANDLLLFGRTNLQDVENLKTTLEAYEKWLG